VIFHHNEIYSLIDKRTKRQIFGDFRKSLEGNILVKDLYSSQLGLCYICKCTMKVDNYDIDHIIPLSLINKDRQAHLITSSDNLRLSCSHCNRSKKSKLPAVYSIFFTNNPNKKWYGVSLDVYKTFKEINKALYMDQLELPLYKEVLDSSNKDIWKEFIGNDIESSKTKTQRKKEGKKRIYKAIRSQLLDDWNRQLNHYYCYYRKTPSLTDIIENRLIIDIDIEEILPYEDNIYEQFYNVLQGQDKPDIKRILHMQNINVNIKAIRLYGDTEETSFGINTSISKEGFARIVNGLKDSFGSNIISKYEIDEFEGTLECDLSKANLVTVVPPILFLETLVKRWKAL